jgi:hypothetical protein
VTINETCIFFSVQFLISHTVVEMIRRKLLSSLSGDNNIQCIRIVTIRIICLEM